MERIDVLTTQPWIVAEHIHRYKFVAQYILGNVLDIACGTGYGAPILTGVPSVKSYCGIDVSLEAIKIADDRLSQAQPSKPTVFQVGDIINIDAADSSFDSVVSLETLEHLRDPIPALRELKRVARPSARILISVPDSRYEAICTEAYGPNKFHFASYSPDDFRELLESVFGSVHLFRGFYGLASVIGPFDCTGGYVSFDPFPPSYIIAVCGVNKGSLADLVNKTNVFAGADLASYDSLARSPLYRLIDEINAYNKETLVAFKRAEEMIDDRDRRIKELELELKALKLASS